MSTIPQTHVESAPFSVRCFRAGEKWQEGCCLPAGHYGECLHKERFVACKHVLVHVPGTKMWVPGFEYCWNATLCPHLNHDHGDE